MKEYMDYVNNEHLPKIDVQKQIEIENLKNDLQNRQKQKQESQTPKSTTPILTNMKPFQKVLIGNLTKIR